MAIIDRLKHDATSDDWFVWKFPSDELRLGAQLIVNESQEALFFKGGQALDLFGPGRHTLTTANIPLLYKLVNLPFGGETPFAAEVWFINKHAKRDLRWGTATPIPLREPVLGYPISVRAHGQWGVRVKDSRSLVSQLVATLRDCRGDRVNSYFKGEIVQRLSVAVAKLFTERKASIFEINAKLTEIAGAIADDTRGAFERFGLELTNFNVERISIPDDELKKLQDVLGKKMEIEQISGAQLGAAYTTMRTFDTLEKAAETEGGVAGNLLAGGLGVGLGLGAGIPAGQQIGKAMVPEPPGGDPKLRLQELKGLFTEGLISLEEFERHKKRILDSL